MDVEGKKAIVTGGVNGIGRCVVESLLREGASVGVLDVDEKGFEGLVEWDQSVFCRKCDVSNSAQVESMVDELYGEFDSIDILVNNAGLIYNSPLVSMTAGALRKHDVAQWDKVLATDLSSVFYVTVNVVEKMIMKRTKGVIVNISSVCSSGNPGQSAYSAAKAGVNALTMTWAKELSPLGIRVAGVAPGFSATEATKKALSEEALRNVIGRVPLRRLGEPSEIADGVLAVIKNDFFNGKILELDGGLVL